MHRIRVKGLRIIEDALEDEEVKPEHRPCHNRDFVPVLTRTMERRI